MLLNRIEASLYEDMRDYVTSHGMNIRNFKTELQNALNAIDRIHKNIAPLCKSVKKESDFFHDYENLEKIILDFAKLDE